MVIAPGFVAIIKAATKIEISENKPMNIISHLNVLKPSYKVSLPQGSASSISVCEKPICPIMQRRKLDRNHIIILKD